MSVSHFFIAFSLWCVGQVCTCIIDSTVTMSWLSVVEPF